MIILVLNCGSSSLKYQVLDMRSADDFTLMAKGLVERIGMAEGDITHKPTGKDKVEIHKPIPDHTVGIKSVLDLLTDPVAGVLKSLNEIDAVGHRVAHGGEIFKESVKVDAKVIENIQKLSDLAPLHNPANLLGIKAVEKLMPKAPQVAVFDTSFHQTMPDYAYTYAVPYEYYEKYRMRRYGFHGTSHKFVAAKGCELAGMNLNNSKIITCHLGNGGSVTAILNGKSVDTSMGFTPTDGVEMGTRSGCIDPGAVLYLEEKEGLDAAGMASVLNKKSGFQGISGVSSDCRDIQAAAKNGNYRAALAISVFCYGVRKFIGAYSAAMGGVDMIIFTGGIGENDGQIRREVCRNLEYLGVKFDETANGQAKGDYALLSTADSKVKVLMVATDEELVIARDTMALTK